ncbi:MAG TPA: manganese efflux pump [Candidatus Onthousia faecipullorum]|uniref:Manganese efflux pump n=1 Tax=Candidatus Onthousia faecipullorum TaxID=2840887 RepID=A0A9D1GBZ2_9FIRM|nr:manganese efflux pump [Candidatus Onthousia faecipullorum]
MDILELIILAIGLSMDAFSLSIVYGTLNLSNKIKNFLSITVGIFHFIMPLLGSILGLFIVHHIISNPDILVGIIFTILSIEMLLNIKELDEEKKDFKSLANAFIFGFSVSIDSFSVGIALGTHNENIILAGTIFAITSFIFTFLGLNIGKFLTLKFGKIANVIGSILLLVLALTYFFE